MKTMQTSVAWLAASMLGVVAVAQDQPAQPTPRLQPGQQQQQPNQPNDQTRRGPGQTNQATDRMGLESHIANCLMLGNQEEIVLLNMGKEKTKSAAIKQAAEMMIEDHQKFIQQLQPHASIQATELTQWLSPDAKSSDQAKPNSGKPDQAQSGQTPANQSTTDANALPGQRRGTPAQVVSNPVQAVGGNEGLTEQLIALEKKVAKECIRLNQEAMQDKDGAEFDKAFVASQVMAHVSMLAKLKGAEDSVSGELQQLVKKGQETTKQHKEKLVSLMKDIKDDSDSK